MAKLAFNKRYRDLELERIVKANEPLDMTLKRADEIVKAIKGKHKGYEDFGYERLDKEEPTEEADETEEPEEG